MRFDSEDDTQFDTSDATDYDPFPLGASVRRTSRRITRELVRSLQPTRAKVRAVPPPVPKRRPAPPPRFQPQVRQVELPIRNMMLPIPSVAPDQRYIMTDRVSKVSLSSFSYRSWAQRLVAPIVAAAVVLGVVFGIALTGGEGPESLPMALAIPAKLPAQRIVVTAISPEPPAPVVTPIIEEPAPVARPVAKPIIKQPSRRRAVSVDASTALGFLRPR